MSEHLCQISAPHSPSTPIRFVLNNSSLLPCGILSCKTNKELKKLWTNKTSLQKTCILYSFLVCLFIFLSLTQEDDDKLTFKCPRLSYRDHTEKDVHFELNPLSLSTFVRIVANPLPPSRCGHPLRIPPYRAKTHSKKDVRKTHRHKHHQQ